MIGSGATVDDHGVDAQEVRGPEESMGNTRDENRHPFESLSSDYDSPLGCRYVHEEGDDYRRRETRGARVDSIPDDNDRPALARDNSLGENNRDLRRCARRLILIKEASPSSHLNSRPTLLQET